MVGENTVAMGEGAKAMALAVKGARTCKPFDVLTSNPCENSDVRVIPASRHGSDRGLWYNLILDSTRLALRWCFSTLR